MKIRNTFGFIINIFPHFNWKNILFWQNQSINLILQMKRTLLLLISIALLSCGTTKKIDNSPATSYGYTEANAIKVGGDDYNNGPRFEREYLNGLTGPNGEEISYHRTGSCCGFETKNGIQGYGMLDKYEVTYEGIEEPVILYLNMYDPNEGEIKAPRGFLLKE